MIEDEAKLQIIEENLGEFHAQNEGNGEDQGVPEWVEDWVTRHGWVKPLEEKYEDRITLPLEDGETVEFIVKDKPPKTEKDDEEREPTVCECVQRLRNFKLHGHHNLYRTLEVDPERIGPHRIPSPENIDELLRNAAEDLAYFWEDYARACPFVADSRLLAFVDAYERWEKEEEPNAYWYYDLKDTAGKLVWAAVEGIAQKVEGRRIDPGPFSYDPSSGEMCTRALMDTEEFLFEMEDTMNQADWPLSKWQEENLEDFHHRTVSEARSYVDYCKPSGGFRDKVPLNEQVESRTKNVEDHTIALETVDDIDSKEYYSGKLMDEMEVTRGIIKTFLEEEWLTHCGMLSWKGEIKPEEIGSHYQIAKK